MCFDNDRVTRMAVESWKKSIRPEYCQSVYLSNFEAGYREGEHRLCDLINRLIQDNRQDEIAAAVSDGDILKKMYREYDI